MTASLSRRDVLACAAAAASVAVASALPSFAQTTDRSAYADLLTRIGDPQIRAGVTSAIEENLLKAISERLYPGQFNITADGGAYGSDSTWPGLDSWQMAGAFLLLGHTRLVLDYFEFVRASQRKDGNIPWAIFTGNTRPDTTWLRGLKYPDGLFTYTPPKRADLPASASEKREWIGMFDHWQPLANPLSNLAPVCYVLTAQEIFEHTRDHAWLKQRLPSLEAAAKWVLGRRSENGLVPGSGFYTELPPRRGWDGITQCYAVHAFRQLAKLFGATGDESSKAAWTNNADALTKSFVETFWRGDHFAEYVHFERGLIDSHGLSDVNFAAIAFGLADDAQAAKTWPLLTADTGFWAGDIPTQSVSKPLTYQTWEYHEPLPFGAPPTKVAAAMGRVWYLETLACLRMGDTKRLIDSTRLVCRAASKDGYWRERYQVQPNGKVAPVGADRYCEYPAVIVRTVLTNPKPFCTT
jgi:hypothetical protein